MNTLTMAFHPTATEIWNICSNDYKGGFGTALMTKDSGLAQDAATRAQAATPLGSLAHQVHHVLFSEFLRQFYFDIYRFTE